MLNEFIPDKKFNTIYDLNYKKIKNKFDVILIDYDNTLMPWHSKEIDNNIYCLLKNLVDNEIKVIVSSNGKSDRLKEVEKSLPKNVELLSELKKPRLKKLEAYIKNNNIQTNRSVFIGDNLVTDIYPGNKLGMYTIKVEPIQFKEYWATKIYRIFEIFIRTIYKRKFQKINKKNSIAD